MPNPILIDIGANLLRDGIDRIRERRLRRGAPADAPLTLDELRELEAARTLGLADDPVAQNARNEEPLAASRTFVGGILALLTAAGALSAELSGADGFDWEVGGPLLGTALAAVVVVIGRARAGLAAIDWRRPWTVFGLGRAARGE